MIKTVYNIDEYKSVARKLLCKKRYQHCLDVADECVKLAHKYGEDPEKAYVAGFLHDIMKDDNPKSMLAIIKDSVITADTAELNSPKLWHAIASSIFVAQRFNIDDEDILNSIRYHTVARANMSKLELIVYVGDLTSEDRDYEDVAVVRELANRNLEEAALYILNFTLNELIASKALISTATVEAYNFYNIKNNPYLNTWRINL